MRRWGLWLSLGIALGAASTLARSAARWFTPVVETTTEPASPPRSDRRAGVDRRSGSERRSGGERRQPRSELVERVGAAAERRIGGRRRSGDDRRTGVERRRESELPA